MPDFHLDLSLEDALAKQMSAQKVAEMSEDVFNLMTAQQQAWMMVHQGAHLVEGTVPARLNLLDDPLQLCRFAE